MFFEKIWDLEKFKLMKVTDMGVKSLSDARKSEAEGVKA